MPPIPPICIATAPKPTDSPDTPGVMWPTLSRVAASAQRFAPRGWKVERAIVADLDGAGPPDLVAVLQGDDPACRVTADNGNPLDTNPRIVIVARGEPGGYRLALANHDVIVRVDDPYLDDPFDAKEGLSVKARVIRLALNWFRSAGGWTTWSTTLSFRWDGTRFAMIGYDREELRRNTGETVTTSANFLTHRMRIDTGSMEDKVPTRTRWVPLRAPAPALETIGDGLEYEPKR